MFSFTEAEGEYGEDEDSD